MTTAKRSMALIFLEDPVCGMTVDPEEARGQATILPMKATLGRGPTDPPSRHPVEVAGQVRVPALAEAPCRMPIRTVFTRRSRAFARSFPLNDQGRKHAARRPAAYL